MQIEHKNKEISFSILMANYNNAKYIKEAIKSILSQTYSNWELIIVDDCSEDNSLEFINEYLSDPRIKLIIHEKNQGCGATKKTAADNASNDILGVLDADDKLHPTALAVMAKAYQDNPNCGLIYSTMWDCDSELKNCKVNTWIGPTIPEKSNIFKISISHFKTFSRNTYLKTLGFDPKQKKAVDKDIIFQLEEVTDLKYVNQPLYYYRQHTGGISQSNKHFKSDYYHYYAKLKAYKRRYNKKIPNLSKEEIYMEYYKMVIYRLRRFLIRIFRTLNLSVLIKSILNLLPASFIPLKSKGRILKIIL